MVQSVALARASASEGSKCGQFVLGVLYYMGHGREDQAAVAQYRLAAAQG